MKHSKTIVTVVGLTVIAISGMAFNYPEIAYISAGALVGYLGKVNGHKEA